MMDVLITEFMNDDVVVDLSREFDVRYDPELFAQRSQIHQLIGPARGLIVRNKTSVDGDLLAAAPRLEVVGRLGVGLDNIDLDECRRRRIEVHPAVGANAASVAEYVIGATLALTRKALINSGRVVAGQWPRQESIGFEIAGKQLGLIGFGGIARLVATRAAALGMTVVAHDPFVARDDPAWDLVRATTLADLLAGSDAVSLHVPLVETTFRLIDSAALATMKPTAVLVNTSRGGIVDEQALVQALRAGRLGGAALDVFETEPLTGTAAHVFAGVPNLIATPHIAGLTQESELRVSEVTAANVRRVLRGGG